MTYLIHMHYNLRDIIVAFVFCVLIFGKQATATTFPFNKPTAIKTGADTTRFSFTGRVVDEKGESLPGATVFITNTKWAANTDNEGMFKLSGILPGNYEVLVRMMGFVTLTKNFTFSDRSINVKFILQADAIALSEVKITAKPDPNRARYLKIFTQNFLGESDNGRQSQILNPNVIRFNFDKRSGTLTAHAVDLIKVKNEGLGYNVNYLLTEFAVNERNRSFGYEGKVYFEELSGDEKKQNAWFKTRSSAYYGSTRHFFRALFAGTATTEGFKIYKIADSEMLQTRVTSRAGVLRPSDLVANMTPLNPDSLIKTVDENRKLLNVALETKGSDTTRLYVCYMRSGEPTRFYNSYGHINIMLQNAQISRVSQVGPGNILLNKDGSLSLEKNVMLEGYWAWQRLADLLPNEVQTSFEVNTVVNTISPENEQTPVEKIHVQMDRPWYLTGDTAWMKVYVTDFNNIPLTDTKICFVELIDANKRVIKNLRLPLNSGMAWGELALNDSLVKNGAYILRVYTTSAQKNSANFFYESIRIIDPNLTPATLTGRTLQRSGSAIDSLKLQFFPEGGTLVADINSRIAIKASAFGKSLNKISGYIADKIGSHITKFEIDDQGIGAFNLRPLADGKYWAVLTLPNGQEKRFTLPQAQQSGVVMSVTHNDDEIVVHLTSTVNNKTLYRLLAKAGERVVYQAEKSLPPGLDSVVISKTELPEGILQFDLYNTGKTLIAKRMVYNQNKSRELKVKLMPNKTNYRPHEKIDININVTDAGGNPVTGSFAVSVNNEADVSDGTSTQRTIATDLFFTGTSNGVINNLRQYDLIKSDADQQRQLDDLLLNLQTEKAKNTEIAQQPLLGIVNDSTTATIEGRVYTVKGKPAGVSTVSLFFISGGPILTAISDNDGKFVFNSVSEKRGSYFYIVAKDKNNKDLNVTVDKYAPPVITDEIMADTADIHFKDSIGNIFKRIDELKSGNILGTQLKEVLIKEKKKPDPTLKDILLQGSTSLAAHADQVLTFIDLLKCGGGDLGQCLALTLNSVVYTTDTSGNPVLLGRSRYPLTIFVDGVERAALDGMSYTEVAIVEYIKGASAAVYGLRGANGVLVITTKNGGINYAEYEMEHYVPGSTKTVPVQRHRFENGFDVAREFYTPDYTETQANIIDKWRPTVYWNPNIVTGADGKAQLSYFTNNMPGTYRVTVEGIDSDGRIARQVFRYTVSE